MSSLYSLVTIINVVVLGPNDNKVRAYAYHIALSYDKRYSYEQEMSQIEHYLSF